MAELRPNIVLHGRHFVCDLGICNPICVKLLQCMFGVIPSNLKQKRRLYLKPFSWSPQTRHTYTDRQTDRHTHTHDDSIRRNAMRCISPKNWMRIYVYYFVSRVGQVTFLKRLHPHLRKWLLCERLNDIDQTAQHKIIPNKPMGNGSLSYRIRRFSTIFNFHYLYHYYSHL